VSQVIGDNLALAIGVAISPLPIIAIVLMLLSDSARQNSLAFLGGWLLGLAIVGAVVLALGSAGSVGTSSGASHGASGIKLTLGILFLLAALRQWRSRPRGDQPPELPKWLEQITSVTPGRAAALAFALAAINPKNLALTIAAALSIAQANLSTGNQVIALAVFVLIAGSTVLAPVLAHRVMGDRAAKPLEQTRAWLVANNAAMTVVLFLVLGAALLGKGIGGLGS
jgi:hypothetical protein